MPNFIEIGVGSRKFSKKLVDLTRNDPIINVTVETPSDPEACDGESVIAVDGAICSICSFRTDGPFWQYLLGFLLKKLHIS